MKPTEMPALRPTANCIRNSFRSSGKRHLLLTGSRGSGKTTLLQALTGGELPGITTWAVPGEAVLLRENGTDNQVRIGIFDMYRSGSGNRMQPLIYGFAALGIPALRRCRESGSQWVSVDEIGYLEQSCPEYCRELTQLMEEKCVIAAVRKQELPFLQQLLAREDAFVVDLDAPFGELGCVIMASGLGKRFGGNKLMEPLGGRPLIGWALEASEGIFARRVVVTRQESVARYCRERGIETVLHAEPYRSDTVRLGLEAVGAAAGCVFCQGDQPLLSRDTLMSLAVNAVNAPASIHRVGSEAAPGAPILFPRELFPELKTLPQGKGGGWTAARHPERVHWLPAANSWEQKDVDTREDLEALRAYLSE